MSPSLPLTPFEEYMLCDDWPAHPMTGFFRLRFSGRLQRPQLEAALRNAVERHPLTRCKVQQVGRRMCWVPDEQFSLNLQSFVATPERQYPRAEAMDLTKGAGTRCWLVERPDGHDLVVQMHHTVTDALGMCQFIEDVLVDYARRENIVNGDVSLRTLDESCLPRRNQFGLNWSRFLQMLPRQSIGLLGARQALMRQPTRLAAVPAEQQQGEKYARQSPDFPSPRTFVFDPHESRQILAAAKRHKVTVNDLLARDLFLAVGDFRRRSGAEKRSDWLRFSVPMNLRTLEDDQLSVANVVSMIFLDRRPDDLKDAQQLLKSVQDEMQLIKRNKLSLTFVLSLAVARKFPGGLQRMVPGDRCWATCVFSNLGVILSGTPLPRKDGKIALGDVTLDELDFVTPLRPHLDAACCVYTYAGRLFVMLHCDPRALPPPQAEELLATYIEQIRHSLRDSFAPASVSASTAAPSAAPAWQLSTETR